jgi:hypothetical protein
MYKDGDKIVLTKSISADVIGEQRKLDLPAGTIASVVVVYGDPNQPVAYEVEAYVEEHDCYVLATVDVADL